MGTYVYARANQNCEWGWWQRLDTINDVKSTFQRLIYSSQLALVSPQDNKTSQFCNVLSHASLVRDAEFFPYSSRVGWYANPNGGFCASMGEIKETIVSDKFPGTDIYEVGVRILQWPNGTHYYAKLSTGEDVVWDGKQKWDSKQEAELAADCFFFQKRT